MANSKFFALAEYLKHQNTSPIRLSFREVESILGFTLCSSARQYSAYWHPSKRHMSTKVYNKLVRDRIPEIIEASGKSCTWETLSDEQYIELLNKKLQEEVAEYLESGTVEELADIGEVMHAILDYKGIPLTEFQRVRNEKLRERGGFAKRILLKEVRDTDD